MKRIFLFYIMAIMAISMSAQNDVTTFLGIPVDGFKSEMKQKLVSKGFVPKKVIATILACKINRFFLCSKIILQI